MRRLIFLVPVAVVIAAWMLYEAPKRPARSAAPRPAAKAAPAVDAPIHVPETKIAAKPKPSLPAPATKPEAAEEPIPDFIGTLDLKEGTASVRGRVLDYRGQGVDGAVVTLLARGGDLDEPIFTDPTGKYEFLGLAAAEYTILCEYAPNDTAYVSQTGSAVLAEGESRTIDFHLDADSGTAMITGKISLGGAGLADCRIEIYSERSSFQATGSTGADGAYLLSGLPVGPALIRIVRTEGETETVLDERDVDLLDRAEVSLDVPAKELLALDVRLLSTDGTPVAEERVCAQHIRRTDDSVHTTIAAWGTTDENGKIRFPSLRPGEYVVAAESARASLRLAAASTLELRQEAPAETSESSAAPVDSVDGSTEADR